jgi:hypothetical protein
MFRKSWLIILALVIGPALGLTLSRVPSAESAHAQNAAGAEQPDRILVRGHGRAVSSLRPPGEEFIFTASNAPLSSFKVVPPGKKFILTDAMYETQGSVRQSLTVNIADANPSADTHDILFQVSLEPGKSDQAHLCSGYVIPAGNKLIAFTNAGLVPEQYVSISVTGYLADQ